MKPVVLSVIALKRREKDFVRKREYKRTLPLFSVIFMFILALDCRQFVFIMKNICLYNLKKHLLRLVLLISLIFMAYFHI